MASISFTSDSLMDPRIQVKLDKYQKRRNIISQVQTVDKSKGYSESTEPIDAVNILPLARFEPTTYICIFFFRLYERQSR